MKKKSGVFDKQDRLARLVKVQQMVAGSPAGITAAEIGRRTDRDKRTALRDLKTLELNGSLPIYRKGDLYKMVAGSTVQMPAFTQPELMSLLLAARLAVQHVDYYNESLAMALNKLAATLPEGPVSAHVGETASQLTEKPEDQKRERVFAAITRGLLTKKRLRFDYVDADGKATKRHVHPYFLEPVSLMTRGIYLVAKDIDRKQIRIFKLDRIRDAEVLAADAYVPSDFELKKLVANSWGIWTNGAIIDVELLFSAGVARRVLETRWHPSQEIERQPGGQLKMTLKVRGVVEITPWILSWGADVEVLKPTALRKALAETAERLSAAYARKPG